MTNLKESHDVIIVGSGAAGGTLVYHLSRLRPDLSILLVEKGSPIRDGNDGKFLPFLFKHYRKFAIGSRSKEGVVVYAAETLGGTSVVACGNLVRNNILEDKFLDLGIDLDDAFLKAEKYLGVNPLPASKIISGSAKIRQAAKNLGIDMKSMPKGVNKYCNGCGNCVIGCHKHAKWDVRPGIMESLNNGNVTSLLGKKVKSILFKDRHAVGIRFTSGQEISGKCIVLSAGGLNTPVILMHSGITAGKGLTIHPFDVVYGNLPGGPTQQKGMTMATYYKPEEGILLSPFLDHWSQKIVACGSWWSYQYPLSEVLGIMVKVADPESTGKINQDGSFNYQIPSEATERLKKGDEIAKNILLEADVIPKSLKTTYRFHRGAHPGCTAKVGEVVDTNLKVVGYKNLFVSDASVIPYSTGTPPILTIVALNIRLASYLKSNL